MGFELRAGIEVLERTPAVLTAWLGGLGEEWTHVTEGPETFSPFDVVGHLIHGELTDWLPRARVILEHGESVTFEPFDRFAMYEASRGKTMDDLLARFAELRNSNLAELRALNITAEQLTLTGMHPRLGVVTMEELLSTWVVHDLGHIFQIARVMSHQYREFVGPWDHLRVLGGSES
jgi:hypothetical protein